MRNKYNPDDVIWFNNVGIVRQYDEQTNTCKYYIKEISGLNEEQDYFTVLDWGSSFPTNAGYELFKLNNTT